MFCGAPGTVTSGALRAGLTKKKQVEMIAKRGAFETRLVRIITYIQIAKLAIFI
jgi:hypothetical protein